MSPELNFNDVFYLTQHIHKAVTSTYNQSIINEIFPLFFSHWVFKPRCVAYVTIVTWYGPGPFKGSEPPWPPSATAHGTASWTEGAWSQDLSSAHKWLSALITLSRGCGYQPRPPRPYTGGFPQPAAGPPAYLSSCPLPVCLADTDRSRVQWALLIPTLSCFRFRGTWPNSMSLSLRPDRLLLAPVHSLADNLTDKANVYSKMWPCSLTPPPWARGVPSALLPSRVFSFGLALLVLWERGSSHGHPRVHSA